jgi:hypothetical protein
MIDLIIVLDYPLSGIFHFMDSSLLQDKLSDERVVALKQPSAYYCTKNDQSGIHSVLLRPSRCIMDKLEVHVTL